MFLIRDPRSTERRREPRYVIESRARVEDDHTGKALIARLINISDHGVQLHVSEVPCAVSGTLRIRVQSEVIFGTLRHCCSEGTRCVLGIELDEPLTDRQMEAVLAES